MTKFEQMRELIDILTIPNFPNKHWSAPCCWKMANHVAKVLGKHTKNAIGSMASFSLSADEVTSIDGQSWISIHIYVCIRFKRVLILLSLSRLIDGNGAHAIKQCIEGMVTHHTRYDEVKVAQRLVYFGVDGVSVFQSSRNSVIVQMKDTMTPFMFGLPCMANRTNLAVEPLSNLPVVSKLEALCQAVHSYFSHSPGIPKPCRHHGNKGLENVERCEDPMDISSRTFEEGNG
jgi:hypothetical protein